MNNSTKACSISKKIRQEVIERDGGLCIFCGSQAVDIMHYIGRGRLGLGIKENLACGCRQCHTMLDHSGNRLLMLERFREKLDGLYPNFKDEDRIYRKGANDEKNKV